MKKIYAGFLAAIITLVVLVDLKAHAIDAKLENPTIRDMYFGFCIAGLLAQQYNGTESGMLDYADHLATKMMERRGIR